MAQYEATIYWIIFVLILALFLLIVLVTAFTARYKPCCKTPYYYLDNNGLNEKQRPDNEIMIEIVRPKPPSLPPPPPSPTPSPRIIIVKKQKKPKTMIIRKLIESRERPAAREWQRQYQREFIMDY